MDDPKLNPTAYPTPKTEADHRRAQGRLLRLCALGVEKLLVSAGLGVDATQLSKELAYVCKPIGDHNVGAVVISSNPDVPVSPLDNGGAGPDPKHTEPARSRRPITAAQRPDPAPAPSDYVGNIPRDVWDAAFKKGASESHPQTQEAPERMGRYDTSGEVESED